MDPLIFKFKRSKKVMVLHGDMFNILELIAINYLFMSQKKILRGASQRGKNSQKFPLYLKKKIEFFVFEIFEFFSKCQRGEGGHKGEMLKKIFFFIFLSQFAKKSKKNISKIFGPGDHNCPAPSSPF